MEQKQAGEEGFGHVVVGDKQSGQRCSRGRPSMCLAVSGKSQRPQWLEPGDQVTEVKGGQTTGAWWALLKRLALLQVMWKMEKPLEVFEQRNSCVLAPVRCLVITFY